MKTRKGIVRDTLILGAALAVAAALLLIFPEKRGATLRASREFLTQMLAILPAVMVLMGLFAVFVPKESVVKFLGKTSGVKGVLIALLLGALPTGPLYVVFPMASLLLKKGARISNIIIFLSAWGCIKIPQELVELQFLGPEFMAARLFLTVVFVVIMGLTVERIIAWTDGRKRPGDEARAG